MPPPITTFCFFFSYTFDATNTHPVTLEFKFFFFQTGHSKQTHKHTQPQNVEDESFSLAARLISFRSIFFYQKKKTPVNSRGNPGFHSIFPPALGSSTRLYHTESSSPRPFMRTPAINHLHFLHFSSCFSVFSLKSKKTTQSIFFSTYTHNFQASKEHTRWEHRKKKKDREGKPAKVRKESMRGQNHCTKMGGKRERR